MYLFLPGKGIDLIKMTMESGSTYVYDDGFVTITPVDESTYTIKAWQFFAFDPEEAIKWNGLVEFMNTVERKDPAVGRRVLVYGKDDWRISTKIKEISYER